MLCRLLVNNNFLNIVVKNAHWKTKKNRHSILRLEEKKTLNKNAIAHAQIKAVSSSVIILLIIEATSWKVIKTKWPMKELTI